MFNSPFHHQALPNNRQEHLEFTISSSISRHSIKPKKQSTNQPINQSINQSINQTVYLKRSKILSKALDTLSRVPSLAFRVQQHKVINERPPSHSDVRHLHVHCSLHRRLFPAKHQRLPRLDHFEANNDVLLKQTCQSRQWLPASWSNPQPYSRVGRETRRPIRDQSESLSVVGKAAW